ncbi:MAG: HAMP domain-containing sensor histidine kinase [Pseudomonadota bacterium]
MNTLSTRLSAALLTLIVLMGGALFAVDRHNTSVYYEELSQTLNSPIAMYVTDQRQLITNGEADLDSLHELAARAMIINPTAEIYLLDTQGRILGHGMPADTALKSRVDLAPVRALLDNPSHLPIRGTDPRINGQRKIFSAQEVRSGAGLEGYLYVVLGGQRYESLAADLGSSYTGRMGAYAALGIVVFTGIVGLIVFKLLTRRIRRLDQAVRRVTASDFQAQPEIELPNADGDEIDNLGRSFVAMSSRINAQIDQLKENDHLRRELISNISHDLRTPLAAIQGYIETLILKGDDMTPDDRDKFLTVARKHTLRLNALIEDLFELSKLDAASVTPQIDRFSLPELVSDTAQEFCVEMERKRQTLDIQVDVLHTQTEGDIGLIQRVLENLVRNAVKFTPEGGQITISVAERSDALAVAVEDNGPGIAEKDIPRIFDRFYRAKDGEEARSDSSGLGLAIVKRILDLHKSRITVQSKLDAGTRFEFELPVFQQAA